MRHRSKKVTLDRKAGPRRALFRNLAAQVIVYEKVETTLAKAKAIRPIVERLITKAKPGDLNARRYLAAYLPSAGAVQKLLEKLGPQYKDRAGGYTRIVKLRRRVGDRAEMAQIELV